MSFGLVYIDVFVNNCLNSIHCDNDYDVIVPFSFCSKFIHVVLFCADRSESTVLLVSNGALYIKYINILLQIIVIIIIQKWLKPQYPPPKNKKQKQTPNKQTYNQPDKQSGTMEKLQASALAWPTHKISPALHSA